MQSKTKDKRETILKIVLPLLTIVFIITVLQLIYTRRDGGFTEIVPQDGVVDISNYDFSNNIYTIANDWAFYPNKIYSHSDFKAGVVDDSEQSPNNYKLGTHRLIIKAKPNIYLSLCGYSTDYASKVIVNGCEVANFGEVTDNEKTSVARTGYQTIPIYTGDDGMVEIICQYNNFVHNEGGTIHATYISTPQNIEDYKTGNNVVSIALGGALLVLALYYLLCAVIQKQTDYLALAFCCFVFAMRDQLFAFISLFPPSTPWEVGYRIYISIINLLPISILLLIDNLFKTSKKWVKYLNFGLMCLFILIIATLDTKLLTTVNYVAYVLYCPYLIYLIVEIIKNIRKNKKLTKSNIVSFLGFGILILALIVEGVLAFMSNTSAVRYGVTPSAMLVFVFLIAISISIKIQEQKSELSNSIVKSQMLEQMNNMNIDFLHNVAHELKTPLTVISGYAQLTDMQLNNDSIDSETADNLKTIQNEAIRLANIVNKLMEYSYDNKISVEFSSVNTIDILKSVKSIANPICLKNNNRVVINTIDENVNANAEMLLQVLINLIVNANKHTQNGIITIGSEDNGGEVIFSVKDTGSGIESENINTIFDKGYSTDNSTGLGLAICKQAIEIMGGKIWLDSTGKNGTCFKFTLNKMES